MIERSCIRSRINLPVLESAQRHIASLDELAGMARRFSLLGDPTRLNILTCLAKAGELCVCDLADILQMDTSAISHQLRKLRDGGLVTNERDGSTIYYRLAEEELQDLFATGRSILLEQRRAAA